jgi:hypothetical protein
MVLLCMIAFATGFAAGALAVITWALLGPETVI